MLKNRQTYTINARLCLGQAGWRREAGGLRYSTESIWSFLEQTQEPIEKKQPGLKMGLRGNLSTFWAYKSKLHLNKPPFHILLQSFKVLQGHSLHLCAEEIYRPIPTGPVCGIEGLLWNHHLHFIFHMFLPEELWLGWMATTISTHPAARYFLIPWAVFIHKLD